MGEELRGKGAGHRPSSLHEELLQFIIDEWAQIPKEVKTIFLRKNFLPSAKFSFNHALLHPLKF